jgi:hypothetical protein
MMNHHQPLFLDSMFDLGSHSADFSASQLPCNGTRYQPVSTSNIGSSGFGQLKVAVFNVHDLDIVS